MTDERLRALARQFQETRATSDEAAWLRERVRSGQLLASRVEIAGSLGHPASLEAAEALLGAPEDLGTWLQETTKEVMSRVAVAMTIHAQEVLDGGRDAQIQSAINAAEDCLACPCRPHLIKCAEWWWTFRTGDTPAGWAAAQLACVVGYDPEGTAPPESDQEALELARGYFPLLAEHALQLSGTLEAVRAEVVPWLLDYSDPLLRRVEARNGRGA